MTGERGVPAAVTDTVTPALSRGSLEVPRFPGRIRPAAQRRGCSPATYAARVGLAKSYAEEAASRGYWSLNKRVCPAHIDDVLLQKLIEESATETTCSYCDNADGSPIAAAFDDFMDHFMVGVRHRYGRANDEGVPFDEGDYVGTRTHDSGDVAEDILDKAIDGYRDRAQDELLDDIVEAMLPDAWVRRNWQWLSKEQRLAYSWDEFKELVKHQTRFLFIRWPKRRPSDPDDLSPLEFFDELVRLLHDLPEKTIDVDTPLYRGRMSLEEPDLNKFDAVELGPAPLDRARRKPNEPGRHLDVLRRHGHRYRRRRNRRPQFALLGGCGRVQSHHRAARR